MLRKERISPDSWDEAIELLVASDISYSTASNLVEEAQEAYEKMNRQYTDDEYRTKLATNLYNKVRSNHLTKHRVKQIIEVFNDETEETTSYTEIGENSFGMIAEEVHEVLPELVTYNDVNEPKRLDYSMISILLLEEVKKLKARIEVLEGN